MLYGTQTQLSLANFGGGRRRLGDLPVFVRAYAQVKQAAAITNNALGVLDSVRAAAITAACEEIAAGGHADQFPTALVVGGGGTTCLRDAVIVTAGDTLTAQARANSAPPSTRCAPFPWARPCSAPVWGHRPGSHQGRSPSWRS
jgi:aspartate ammonia-lyase